MKCFTFSKGKIQSGIVVSHHGRGAVVRLGNKEGGNGKFDLSLFHPNPAEIDHAGVIHDAHPVELKNRLTGFVFTVLAAPKNNADQRVLVRLTGVEWQSFLGDVEEIALGWTVEGEHYAYDTLLMLKPGAVIRVRCKDCSRPSDAVMLVGNELRTMPFRTFMRMATEAELEDIDGVASTSHVPERSLGARLGSS